MAQSEKITRGKKFSQAIKLLENCNDKGLEKDMVFKNFKELCEFLSEPVVFSKNSKIAQEAKFRMCFDYYRVKGTYKIVIKEVYTKPIKSAKN